MQRCKPIARYQPKANGVFPLLPGFILAASLVAAWQVLGQERTPAEPPVPTESAPQTEKAGLPAYGYGFRGALGIPESAIPGRKWVASAGVIIAVSDDGKQVFGYSEQHPRWAACQLQPLPADVAVVPVVADDLAAVRHGRYCHAYSATLGTWDTLELPAGEVAVPAVGSDGISVLSTGKGDYVFKNDWGKWFSAQEIKAGKVAQHLRAQPGLRPAAQAKPGQFTVFRLQYAEAQNAARMIHQLLRRNARYITVVADERINSLLVDAEAPLLGEVERLVELLDAPHSAEKPPRETAARQGDWRGPARGRHTFSIDLGSAGERVEDLRQDFHQIEQRTKTLAAQLRQPRLDPAAATKLRAELRDVVQQAFEARQKLQRAELVEFARRLQSIQQSLEMRERIRQQIIDRRLEELLDPNLKWDPETARSKAEAGAAKRT